jgi:Tol biopolymer transport system component
MRSMRTLPLLAMVWLAGCDGGGEWLRGHAAGSAYAAPLASDTSVLAVRRVWSEARIFPSTVTLELSTIMPDGSGIATTDWQTGNPAIFDLGSREFHTFQLNQAESDAGMALQTVVSPDGSRILFIWYPNGSEETQLRVVDITTGASRTVAVDTAAESLWPFAWSPAGDSAFAWRQSSRSVDVDVVLVPITGGTPRLVHTVPMDARWGVPAVSPDGRWLLYNHEVLRDQQSRSDIHIIDVQGGGARPLVQHPAIDQVIGWLPDTDVVLFSSDRSGTTDIWSVRVANGRVSAEPRVVRSGFFRSSAVGFADGALFYMVNTGSSGPAIVNVDPRTGAILGAASPPLAGFDRAWYRGTAWSPDGQTLAALTWDRSLRTVTLHSLQTGESRVYRLDKDIRPHAAQWSADGKALFVRAGEAGSGATAPQFFLRLDLVTGATARVFAAPDPGEAAPFSHLFRVTPDGRSVMLLSQLPMLDGARTGMRIVLRSLEDGSERELHRTSGYIPEFSISADGIHLAFMQQAWDDSDSLFVMRMDGSQPLRAVSSWDPDEVTLLGWLPAGNALLGARLTEDGNAEEILRIELDGSSTVVAVSPFRPGRGARTVPGYFRSRLVLSPAGNRLVHTVSDIGRELWRLDGLHELFASDATGRR